MLTVRERSSVIHHYHPPNDKVSNNNSYNNKVRIVPVKPQFYTEQTTDPRAKVLKEATIIFRAGIKKARVGGDLEIAIFMIATAFLMDSRAMKFILFLPQDTDVVYTALHCLDMELLQDLLHFGGGKNIASQVLKIYSAIQFGHLNGAIGQTRIVQALTIIDKFLNNMYIDPKKESFQEYFLRSLMKQTTLYHMRAILLVSMGSTNAAMSDLTEALKLNPTLTNIRCNRACLYASTAYDGYSHLAMHEFIQVVQESHPDASELPLAYAWLAKLILENLDLGTFQQAEAYWKRSRMAALRCQEIYGEDASTCVEEEMKIMFGNLEMIEEEPPEQHSCEVCGLFTNRAGGPLFLCSDCKQVRYCSPECQETDWMFHCRECKS